MEKIKVDNIKLRAWDERNKLMHYDFQFIRSGIGGGDWILFTSDRQPIGSRTSDGRTWDDNPYFSQQFKIMECTGLIDDKNKPIFTGDIVEVCFDDVLDNTSVKYVGVIERINHLFYIDFLSYGRKIELDEDTINSIEIIGNEWENSDTLDKTMSVI